jgi:hypothetical protein
MDGSASGGGGGANAPMVARIATSRCLVAVMTFASATSVSVPHPQSARGSSSAAGEVEILALFNHHLGRRHLAVRKLENIFKKKKSFKNQLQFQFST